MLTFLRKIISYDNPLRILWHRLKGFLAAVKYGFPGRKMVMIGITGTNGKTTTTHMTEHLLHTSGKKVAMMSTVEFRFLGKQEPNTSKKTTLSPFLVQKFLKRCKEKNVDYVVVECSSHALHQSRLWGIPFEIAAITNITHEHLDYHGTLEKYAEAKKILFKVVEANSPKNLLPHIPHKNMAILNTADQFYSDYSTLKCPQTSYGIGAGDLQAKSPQYTKYGSKFQISHTSESLEIELKMPGAFNVENALAATGVALASDLSLVDVKKGLETFEGVPGRMERIKSPKGFEVIVDFALTPDALERLYKNIRETAPARVFGIIGSCGDRDQKKRPDMGRIVAEHTNLCIVTDEEPYTENPRQIMDQVMEGAKTVRPVGQGLELIEDRYKAIEHAVQNAKEGDIIVVTGMGNFTTRTLNEGEVEWDEREVVREIIGKY